MKLNKDNKHEVRQGDFLRFSYGDCYRVNTIIPGIYRNAINFTLQDVKTKQTIYSMPSSECYGAEIIRMEDFCND